MLLEQNISDESEEEDDSSCDENDKDVGNEEKQKKNQKKEKLLYKYNSLSPVEVKEKAKSVKIKVTKKKNDEIVKEIVDMLLEQNISDESEEEDDSSCDENDKGVGNEEKQKK